MIEGLPIRLTAETADELCRLVELTDGAKLLMRPGQTPRELLDLLIGGRHHLDAIRLMAHAMPKREAVWWAISCAKLAHGDTISKAASTAIAAAEAWVSDPSDANRRATMPAADAVGLGTPAGCACASAFFSGGSLAPVGVPEVPPGEHVTAQLAAAAVSMAAVLIEPEKAADKQSLHLTLGRKIIDGMAAPPPLAGFAPSRDNEPSAPAGASEKPRQPSEPTPNRPSLFF